MLGKHGQIPGQAGDDEKPHAADQLHPLEHAPGTAYEQEEEEDRTGQGETQQPFGIGGIGTNHIEDAQVEAADLL